VCRVTSADLMSNCVPAAEEGGLVSASWAVRRRSPPSWGTNEACPRASLLNSGHDAFKRAICCTRSVATGRRRMGPSVRVTRDLPTGNGRGRGCDLQFVNLHQAPPAVALSALACAVVAVLFRESSVGAVFVCAAAVLIVVSAILETTRFPADDRVLRCPVCRQRFAGDGHGGLCSAVCAAEYRDVLDRQEEEDYWWRAIA
jgi:hypothetical protein